jgi:hypothetical protein
MRWRTVLVAALVLLPALAFAGPKKKKASIPAIFGTAQYVYVTAEAGDLYNPNLLPEDRDAISNVMNALRDWGRYIVMPTASGSELVFIVRKGRVASADVAGGAINPRTGPYGSPGAGPNSAPQSGPNSSPGTGPTGAQSQVPIGLGGVSVGGEVGPPDDFLEVRMRQPGGDLSGPIWEHTMTNGLDAPRVLLLDQLKRSVEKDYPQK